MHVCVLSLTRPGGHLWLCGGAAVENVKYVTDLKQVQCMREVRTGTRSHTHTHTHTHTHRGTHTPCLFLFCSAVLCCLLL